MEYTILDCQGGILPKRFLGEISVRGSSAIDLKLYPH